MNNKRLKKVLKRALGGLLCIVLLVTAVVQSGYLAEPVLAADNGINYRVGIVYGKSVKKTLQITSTAKYTFGLQSLSDSSKSFTTLGTFNAGSVYVTVDGYNRNSDKVYSYHLQITTKHTSYSSAYSVVEQLKKKLPNSSVFVACTDGAYYVRLGNYTSAAAATNAISSVKATIGSSYSLTATSPEANTLTVHDANGYIILKFRSSTHTLGLKVESGYMTYNSKTYEGVMSFKRYTTSDYDGVQLVSVLPIERYVMCVIPNEIMISWPKETIKAFAIAVRSYALSGLNYYNSSYGFDITATSQVYGMASNLDDKTYGPRVISAVNDTSGLVMEYNGKVAEAYYSSSVGGVTVGSGDAYVTAYPYLVAVETPWEKYASLSSGYHGLWTKELTGAQLLSNIKAYGYASLKGTSITKLTVNSYGTNSTYVKSVTVTDNLGNTATISGADNVRTRLGLYSANFVVGKGSVKYTYDTVTTVGENPYDGKYPAFNLSDFNVITSAGKLLSRFTKGMKIQTGSGVVSTNSPKANVITGSSTSNGHSVYNITTTTATASGSSSNFIFAGKGWGHGVGLSQFGIRDLGNLGYTYDEMLNAYYTGINIVSFYSLK
ncbi:MAG: SpoIID/LytB domain-containing protein [Ruminococcaceae bacterium]|nr:SpoIID/LytB domain-containing protein [Oscillospiraceae bacterium]